MTEHDNEHEAREVLRKAFPVDAGLSAEKTRELHGYLRAAETQPPRHVWSTWAVVASVAAVLVVGLGSAAIYATRPTPALSPAAVASAGAPVVRPDANGQLVPALALQAISSAPAEVLHFTSAADTEFGPNAGHSTEEMWFDPKSGSGRLVRKDLQGDKVIVTTTIVSDGSAADVITQKAGQQAVTTAAGAKERRSFDKLSAYRNMLESGAATVTARGTKDGVETYKLRAVMPGFGGSEFEMVMEAEVRASDYLPLSYSSAFRSADGDKSLKLRSRTFSKFERLKTGDLPADWFKPKTSGKVRDDGAQPGVVEI